MSEEVGHEPAPGLAEGEASAAEASEPIVDVADEPLPVPAEGEEPEPIVVNSEELIVKEPASVGEEEVASVAVDCEEPAAQIDAVADEPPPVSPDGEDSAPSLADGDGSAPVPNDEPVSLDADEPAPETASAPAPDEADPEPKLITEIHDPSPDVAAVDEPAEDVAEEGNAAEEAAAGEATAAKAPEEPEAADTEAPASGDDLARRLQMLRAALSDSFARVIDIFREWDDDGNGSIDKREFRKVLPVLGVTIERAEADALFDSFDSDGSGSIDYTELNARLRAGADITLAGTLQDGARDDILKVTHRAGELASGTGAMFKIDLKEDDDPVSALREALSNNMGKVIDLFRQWDDDGSGTVSKKEFRRALPILGVTDMPREVADAIFDSLDSDKSGSIEYQELQQLLRRRSQIPNFGNVHVETRTPRMPTVPKLSTSAPPTTRYRRPARAVRVKREPLPPVDPQRFIDNLNTLEALVAKVQGGAELTDAESDQLRCFGVDDSLASSSPTAAALARQRGLRPQLENARTCELSSKAHLLSLQRELREMRAEQAAKEIEEQRRQGAKAVRALADPTQQAVRVDFSYTTPASAAEVNELSARFNQGLAALYADPRSAWYKVFRRVDVNESMTISFVEFLKIVREELELPKSALPDERIRSLWVALDSDGQGGQSGLITCKAFAHFMRKGEHVFPQKDGAWRERIEAKARGVADSVRADKHLRLHRHIADELVGQEASSASAMLELSTRFNNRLEELRRAESGETEATGAWFKLFRFMDTDNSGLVCFSEFRAMVRDELELPPSELSELEIKRAWLALDADKSGHICSGEFGRFSAFGGFESVSMPSISLVAS